MKRLAILSLFASFAVPGRAQTSAPVSVTTYRYDNTRIGWNRREAALSPANVKPESFGKAWSNPLDGAVEGAPLLLTNAKVKGVRDVLYGATDRNSVWALDAKTGEVLWSRRELMPPVPDAAFHGTGWGRNTHGVRSTPVLDARTNTIYLCGVRVHGLRQQYVVWGLDALTGQTRKGWPRVVAGTDKGATFAAGELMQRGALTLHGDWLYVPFGSRGDVPPWRGWIMSFNTRDPGQTRAFCSSPRTDGAGFWNATGLSADGSGSLYAVAGNGQNDLAEGGDNLGQTVLRLRPSANGLRFTKSPRDYYLPFNYRRLDERDEGLGSSAAIVLPRQANTSTPHLLFTGGKDGFVYLLNRDNLGGVNGQLQSFGVFNKPTTAYHDGIRATPAYFDAGFARFLYVASDEPGPAGQKSLVAFELETPRGKPARLRYKWSLRQAIERTSSPTVSSLGASNGLVWLIESSDFDNPSALRAYDALDGRELYSSKTVPNDALEGGRKFINPVVANGRVYVGARGLWCYGLLKRPVAAPAAQTQASTVATAQLVAATPTPTPQPTPTTANQPAPTPTPGNVNGTIVSVRGNILVVKPILRLSRSRVAFGPKTEVVSYRRTQDRSLLKVGRRIELGGPLAKDKPWSATFITVADGPNKEFDARGEGIKPDEKGEWQGGKGTITKLEPLTLRDDKGKTFTASLDTLRGIWRMQIGGRETLLIGTRINAVGPIAPDGVMAAIGIYPERTRSQEGTMFGTVLSVRNGIVTLRPRYTRDTVRARLAPNAKLLREVPVAPESLRVGQPVTVWAERRPPRRPDRPWDPKRANDLKAYAVLLGEGRYPIAADPNDPRATRYVSGRLASLFPATLQVGKQMMPLLPTAQMPIARLVPVTPQEFKRGEGAMFVLSLSPDGGFTASSVVLDAAPWVGYGQ